MRSNGIYRLIMAGFMALSVLACSGTFATAFPTQTNSAPTKIVNLTPPPTSAPTQKATLSSVSLHEENKNPNYEIKAQVPTLNGNADARVTNFNTAMLNLVNIEINKFKKDVSELSPAAYSVSPNSFLDVTYALALQRENLWSLKFDFSGYYAGAAHPFGYSATVNYDLAEGRQLSLGDLFLPNSNYLEVISNICIAELSKRNIGFEVSSTGAAPTLENYRNWNLTPDGLLITFDEGRVVAYAAGPQTVVVPYRALQTIMNPQGPLTGLAR